MHPFVKWGKIYEKNWRSPQLVFVTSSCTVWSLKNPWFLCYLCPLQKRKSAFKQFRSFAYKKSGHFSSAYVLYWPKYWIFSTPSCRQSACHWSRPYRQSPTRIQESKSANCESAHRVASFWKGVSWAAVSSRSSSTLWPPRDTPLKSSSSLPPSLVEMWVAYLTLLQRKHPHVYKITNPLLLIRIQRKGFKRPTHRSC